MKIPKEPVSAFAVYSEKLRQKKKRKTPVVTNGVSKIKKKTEKNGKLSMLQLNEISNIMQTLAKHSLSSNAHGISSNNSNQNKVAEKVKNKLDINNKKNTSNKHNKLRQSKNSKSINHDKEENLIDYVENESLIIKDPVKKIKKNEKNPNKSETVLIEPKTKKMNSQQNRKNKTGLKRKKVVVDAKEDDSDPILSERKSKVNRNKVFEKLKKKKNKVLEKTSTKTENSELASKRLFEWLILPITEKNFMRDYWEKQPLLVQREGNRTYFSELISTLEIDSMMRKNNIQFTKHLDITSYTDQTRETHNLRGRAQANAVWDFYSNGCSVRLLNPQAFLPKIHTLNATLQGYFGCFVGANVYLTPPNSQGFAPHYDDIEAFVLQIEGKKHWQVYAPRCQEEILPRYSSPNFTQEEIGDPLLDVTLEPGDMLYFPRGFIHQASTVEGEHSLHITLSAYQKTAWIDLLEKALPIALQRAAVEDVEFRKGLPRDYLGIEFHGSDREKESFNNTAQRLMSKVAHFLNFSLGDGVDKMGAQFMHDALPPVFTPEEKKNMVLGSGLKMKHKGKLTGRVDFQMDTEIKLVRSNACRLVVEEEELRLYHCVDNPLEYHAEDPQFLVLPDEGGGVITHLATRYPAFVQIGCLPYSDKDALLALISDLWEAGLLLTKEGISVGEDD